jgi:hypothetical protein
MPGQGSQVGSRVTAVPREYKASEEVLPPGRGQEPLQPVVIGIDAELLHQVKRRLVDPHQPEELRRGHEDCELQLGLDRAARQVAHPVLAIERADALRVGGRVVDALLRFVWSASVGVRLSRAVTNTVCNGGIWAVSPVIHRSRRPA